MALQDVSVSKLQATNGLGPSGSRALGILEPIRSPDPAATTIAYVTTTG